MFRKFATIFGTLGVLGFGVGLVIVMQAARPKLEKQKPVIEPPTIFFEVARPQTVTLRVQAQGEVNPRTDISLTAQVSGKVVKTAAVFVDGGAFEKGDLLVKIEDADYRAALASARARVAQAEEALRREEAEAELARSDYEDLGRDTAPSELTLRVPQLAQARANYQAAKADERSAVLNLERTSIRAPFDGRVRERVAGLGQFVSPGAQIGRIFATDVAEIKLPLTDGDLAALDLPLAFTETKNVKGPSVQLSAVVAGDLHNWQGRIARTGGVIDPGTRQVSAIAVVDDPYGAGADNGTPLIMGLFVDAVITGKPYQNAMVLPRRALYGRNEIYVIGEDNRLQLRNVAIVASDRDTITVASGIQTGDRIVVSPLRGAGDGDEVTPAQPDDNGSGSGTNISTSDDQTEASSSVARAASSGDKL